MNIKPIKLAIYLCNGEKDPKKCLMCLSLLSCNDQSSSISKEEIEK